MVQKPCNVIGVNYYLNSNCTKYLAQTPRLIVYVLENFHRSFGNLLAPPTDGTTKRLVCCAVTASKSIHNWQCYSSSKCYEIDENVWFGIWRSAVSPSDAAEGTAICLHNYGLTGAQLPQTSLGKFTSCMTFGAHNFVHSEPFLDYLYEL